MRDDKYESGDVQVHRCTEDDCYQDPDEPTGWYHSRRIAPGVAYLPHQCDEWVIGGRRDVERLIADLQALLPLLENQ